MCVLPSHTSKNEHHTTWQHCYRLSTIQHGSIVTGCLTDWQAPSSAPLLQAATYWQFFLLRTMTGISVGGSFPLVYSLLGDLVPIESRSAVSAAVAIANGVGIAAGQVRGCRDSDKHSGLLHV